MFAYFQKRWRNAGFWLTLIPAILLVMTQFGLKVDNEWVMNTVKAILSVLTIIGIMNDPTTETNGFGDDPEK